MNTTRISLLALAVMAVFLAAALLYSIPRRPPDAAKARYDFLSDHRDTTVESVELDTLSADLMAYRVRYRPFASNDRLEEVLTYRKEDGKGWQLK